MHQRHAFLICYDIGCPRRLRRVYMSVKDWAMPVQKSVFVAQLRQEELDGLLLELETLIDADEDSLQVFRLHRPQPDRCLGVALIPNHSWTV